MNAREVILERIRTARRDNPPPAAARIAHIRPALDDDPAARFVARIGARSASVAHIASHAEVGHAVREFLAANGLPARLAVAPALQDLCWPADVELHFGSARADDTTSVTPCFAAIAESGSLVLLSGPRTPTTLNFVPANHIVIVEAGQLVAHPEDVWAQLARLPGGMPRTVNLIAGPSRTADVEQTIQLGAHGPRRLHVLLVGAPINPTGDKP